jgi:hypothetical protein
VRSQILFTGTTFDGIDSYDLGRHSLESKVFVLERISPMCVRNRLGQITDETRSNNHR